MRNLMSLLMTRSEDEIARIAAVWSVEPPRAGRSERAAVLGREMVRDASGRRFWERIRPETRDLWLRLADEPELSLSELGASRDAPELAEALDAGLVWAFEEVERRGGAPSLTLPPVPDPVLILPSELCRLAGRLATAVERGEASERTLDLLLPELGSGELENLASYWGVAAEPGGVTRDELIELLLNRLSGASTERVTAEAPSAARKLYAALIEAGGSAPTRDLGKSAGLPPSVLREAVSDLNDRLLALEDYRDGWRLFAPLGPRHHLPGAGGPTNTPEPTIAPTGHTAAPEWAGAWDLLNLLRALEIYEVPEEPSGRLPGAFRSRFETSLASRPSDPGAAINYLYADARRLGLVQNSGSAVKPSARAGSWVAAGLAEQTRRLLAAWTEHGAAGETESLAKSAGFREDADLMQAARRALLAALAACEPGVWYTIAGLVEVVRAASPNILRPQNRLVRDLGSSGARAALENWVEVEGAWIRRAIIGPLSWLHVVEVGEADLQTGEAAAWTPAPEGGWLTGRSPRPPRSDAQPRIAATPEGRVRISAPDSATIWMLAGFARPVRAGRRPGYLIDRRTVARARGIGVGPDEIVSFLRRHSESAIPTRLVELIQEWGREPHRVVLRPAIVVRCETEAGLEELVASPIVRSYSPVRLGDDTVVLTLSEGGDYEELDAMLRRLTKSGLFSAERYSGR